MLTCRPHRHRRHRRRAADGAIGVDCRTVRSARPAACRPPLDEARSACERRYRDDRSRAYQRAHLRSLSSITSATDACSAGRPGRSCRSSASQSSFPELKLHSYEQFPLHGGREVTVTGCASHRRRVSRGVGTDGRESGLRLGRSDRAPDAADASRPVVGGDLARRAHRRQRWRRRLRFRAAPPHRGTRRPRPAHRSAAATTCSAASSGRIASPAAAATTRWSAAPESTPTTPAREGRRRRSQRQRELVRRGSRSDRPRVTARPGHSCEAVRRPRSEELGPVLNGVPDRDRRGLAEPADRGHRHRLEPFVDLAARHRRAAVLELLGDVVEGAVADPARSALLARLLGEEPHRLARAGGAGSTRPGRPGRRRSRRRSPTPRAPRASAARRARRAAGSRSRRRRARSRPARRSGRRRSRRAGFGA